MHHFVVPTSLQLAARVWHTPSLFCYVFALTVYLLKPLAGCGASSQRFVVWRLHDGRNLCLISGLSSRTPSGRPESKAKAESLKPITNYCNRPKTCESCELEDCGFHGMSKRTFQRQIVSVFQDSGNQELSQSYNHTLSLSFLSEN